MVFLLGFSRNYFFWGSEKATANAEGAKDAKGRGGVRHPLMTMELS
jgi:hypothetical protein